MGQKRLFIVAEKWGVYQFHADRVTHPPRFSQLAASPALPPFSFSSLLTILLLPKFCPKTMAAPIDQADARSSMFRADNEKLPQPQNTNHISSAPFKDKILSNSSYLAAELPLKFGHWVSHLWQQQQQQDASNDSTIWLLGCGYEMLNMSNMEEDIQHAQSETFFDLHKQSGSAEQEDQRAIPQGAKYQSSHQQSMDPQQQHQKLQAIPSFSMALPPDFYEDFVSRLWMTYRHNFPPIRPSSYKTDIGWGCMLRSGQSLLANALLIHYLGREWRRDRMATEEQNKTYRRIIQWFLDELSPRAPFSIHRIALLGKQLGKNIGEWFGPSTISQVILALVSDFPSAKLPVYIATDGVVYRDVVDDVASNRQPRGEFKKYWCQSEEAREIYQKYTPQQPNPQHHGNQEKEFGSMLVLVAIRLGIDHLHPTYYPALKECMRLPWFVGIAGGRPNSSLYFIGLQGDDLVYLDPHFSRAALETKAMHEYSKDDLDTYHCTIPRKIHISQVDPSMMLGFYCRTKAEFDAFCDRITQVHKEKERFNSLIELFDRLLLFIHPYLQLRSMLRSTMRMFGVRMILGL
ncbi:hypothetical protein BX666DRAFT_1885926 [Dichotomocladium elegans]|nr:hypothetical protein BX666DRAFT_1885926 [Dichotomocladium elegans]